MKKMDKYFNTLSVMGSLVGGAGVYVFGGWDMLIKALLMLAVIDFLTGWVKGVSNKNLSSAHGFKGIAKKVLMFSVVAVSNIIQGFMSNEVPLREIVITFYVCNEALSILENSAEFIPIPEKFRNILLQIRDKEAE